MNKRKPFSISQRLKSFGYAFSGLKILITEEHNARIHLFAAACVVAAGIYFKLSSYEWIALAFAIGLVFALEIVNSSIENLADFITPNHDDRIKKIKDLAAAAVLIGAMTALAIGLIIFLPKIINPIN
jgi:diacylglycerol kinase